MKYLIIIPLLILTLSCAGAEKRIRTEIKEVTVFFQGAEVTNKGAVTLSVGSNQVIVDGLSAFLDPNSIRVQGEGDFTILGVSHRFNYLSPNNKPKEIRSLEDSLESLKDKLEFQQNMKKVYEQEESLLLANKSIGGVNVGVNVSELEKAANLFRTRLAEIKMKMIQIKNIEKQLQTAIQLLQSQLAEVNERKSNTTSEVEIVISAKAAVSGTLTVTYTISKAGWAPSYDIRATKTDQPVELTYKANLWQNSGSSWDNVKLTLSTSNPAMRGVKPNLAPWWLYLYDPVTVMPGRSHPSRQPAGMPSAAEMVQEKSSMAEGIQDALTTADFTTITEGAINVEFDIKLPYTIPTDGKKQTIEVQRYSLPATFTYYAAPKLDPNAFLLARVSNWDKLNLLPGEANVFFEGTMVGRTYIDSHITNDTLDVSLGIDKNITVTRTRVDEQNEKVSLGQHKKETFAYEITVRNRKKVKVNMLIEDQIPLSRNENVEVEMKNISSGDLDKETGKVSWKAEIAPGESKKMRLIYSVKYPKDRVISNL